MKTFHYSAESPLNGILRYLYNISQQNIFNEIETYATSIQGQHVHYNNVFDFNPSTGWDANSSQKGDVYLYFCLKNYYAVIEGYEFHTSEDGNRHAVSFNFSYSNNKINWYDYKYYYCPFKVGDKKYFYYKSAPAKCFKLTCLLGANNYNSFDVMGMDVYGQLSSSLLSLKDHFTCKRKPMYQNIFNLFSSIALYAYK